MDKFRTPVATNGRLIEDANGIVIAVSAVYGNDIVRCVNSHDALVKAAKDAAAVLSGNDLSKSGLVIALESIRTALAAAGAPQ